MGISAHGYDNFAPQFTDKFHVYALSRRGFGNSSQPKTGYEPARLAKDILMVLDHLKIKKAILIGHSIAGSEMTKFASTYPNRVEKLVYLEAGYDNTTEPMEDFVYDPSPEPKKLDSLSSHTSKFNTPDFVYSSVFTALEHPDYKNIQCEALALYSGGNLTTGEETSRPGDKICSYYYELDSADQKKMERYALADAKWAGEQIELFKKEVKNSTVKIIKGTSHGTIFNPEVAIIIREFLK